MADKWVGNTYGNSWMHRTLISLLKYVDVRVFYVFSYIFVVPPCLIFRDGYAPIYRYFRKRFNLSHWHSFLKAYANHCMFSQMVIDKFAMYAGKKFDIKVDGYEHFERLVKGEDGFIQLSSHIGNYEIAGYSLTEEDKTMNALVYDKEKMSIMNNRTRMFNATNIRMIPIQSDLSHLFAISAALDNKEIVSMPADRVVGSQKVINVEFLGGQASLPMGPFALAAMRQSNVIAVNVMKTATKQYTIYVFPLDYDKTATRKEQVQQLADSYIAALESSLKAYPTQWFNYYEFWNQ